MGAEWLHQIQSFTPASFDALAIDEETSDSIFKRNGKVNYIKAYIEESQLK